MRTLASLLVILALTFSGGSAFAQTAGTGTKAPMHDRSTMTDQAAASSTMETDMRSMCVAMGAMTAYMVYVMPITTGAIVAAVGAGVATAWAYDYSKGVAW